MTRTEEQKKKEMKTSTVTETELISTKVAMAAISLMFNGASLRHYKTRRRKNPESFILSGTFPASNKQIAVGTTVEAVISWSEGQEGIGSVEVSRQAKPEYTPVVRKYSCWKNEAGEVEVEQWYEPFDELHRLQRKHGMEWPRNKKLYNWFHFLAPTLGCWVITFAIVVVIIGSNSPDAALTRTFTLAWAFGISTIGAVLGMLLGYRLHVVTSNEKALSAWSQEETRMDAIKNQSANSEEKKS